MNYYNLALATGLTHDQAVLFAAAMERENKTDINHLNIKS